MFKVEDLGRTMRVTMERSPVNALSNAFVEGFERVLDAVAVKPDLAVLHIRSNQRVFSAGADLAQVRDCFAAEDGAQRMQRDIRRFHRLFDRIESLSCVTFAEIGGSALGGGFELSLACDLRMAAADARIGLPEARLGLIPGAGGTQRLTRLCGPGVAARIILACEIVDGARACELGMVQWAVPADELPERAQAVVAGIAELSTAALRVSKHCMAAAVPLSRHGLETELRGTRELMGIDDTRNRISDFFKRG